MTSFFELPWPISLGLTLLFGLFAFMALLTGMSYLQENYIHEYDIYPSAHYTNTTDISVHYMTKGDFINMKYYTRFIKSVDVYIDGKLVDSIPGEQITEKEFYHYPVSQERHEMKFIITSNVENRDNTAFVPDVAIHSYSNSDLEGVRSGL